MALICAQCVFAAGSDYCLNGAPFPRKGGASTRLKAIRGGEGGIIAIRAHSNNVAARRYEGSFLHLEGESAESVPVFLPFVVSPGDYEPVFTGTVFNFNRTVFGRLHSITFKPEDRCSSMFREISITRKSLGPIGLHGTIDFTRPFEVIKSTDGALASFLPLDELKGYFLVTEADNVEFDFQPHSSKSPKGKHKKHK